MCLHHRCARCLEQTIVWYYNIPTIAAGGCRLRSSSSIKREGPDAHTKDDRRRKGGEEKPDPQGGCDQVGGQKDHHAPSRQSEKGTRSASREGKKDSRAARRKDR